LVALTIVKVLKKLEKRNKPTFPETFAHRGAKPAQHHAGRVRRLDQGENRQVAEIRPPELGTGEIAKAPEHSNPPPMHLALRTLNSPVLIPPESQTMQNAIAEALRT